MILNRNTISFFLDNNFKIPTGFYNAGFENMSILEVANIIKSKLLSICKDYLIKYFNYMKNYYL